MFILVTIETTSLHMLSAILNVFVLNYLVSKIHSSCLVLSVLVLWLYLCLCLSLFALDILLSINFLDLTWRTQLISSILCLCPQKITAILTGTGLLFVAIFQIGTPELRTKKSRVREIIIFLLRSLFLFLQPCFFIYLLGCDAFSIYLAVIENNSSSMLRNVWLRISLVHNTILTQIHLTKQNTSVVWAFNNLALVPRISLEVLYQCCEHSTKCYKCLFVLFKLDRFTADY